MNLGRALILEIDLVLASEVSPRDVHLGMVSIFEIDPVLRIGGLSSRRDVVAAALTSRQGCVTRHRNAATANLVGRESSKSIPHSASEVSPRDVNLGRALIFEVDPALNVGGLTSRRESWKGVDPRARSRVQRRRSHLAT